jgi:hypothetical protein
MTKSIITKKPRCGSPAGTSIADLLGPPPVILGEDARKFEELHTRITAAMKPREAIEEIWVRDVADLTWEVLRLRRLKASLLLTCAHAGLVRVLKPLVGSTEAEQLAAAWAKRDAAAVAKVKSLLAASELTVDAIMAETLTLKLEQTERFEAMIAVAEARLAAALREVDRHRATLAGALRATVEDIEDAEFEEIPAQPSLPEASA